MIPDSLARATGPNLTLRLITPDDADFVFALRSDPDLGRHLGTITGTAADQRRWIEGYKTREAALREFYYVIERHDGTRCGLVRLYDLRPDAFTWGSFVLGPAKPPKAALESAILSFGIGFDHLDLPRADLDVRIANTRAHAFYLRLGMTETHRDAQNIFLTYGRDRFLTDRPAYMALLQGMTAA